MNLNEAIKEWKSIAQSNDEPLLRRIAMIKETDATVAGLLPVSVDAPTNAFFFGDVLINCPEAGNMVILRNQEKIVFGLIENLFSGKLENLFLSGDISINGSATAYFDGIVIYNL